MTIHKASSHPAVSGEWHKQSTLVMCSWSWVLLMQSVTVPSVSWTPNVVDTLLDAKSKWAETGHGEERLGILEMVNSSNLPAEDQLEPDIEQGLNCLSGSVQPPGIARKLPSLDRKPQNQILHGLCIHTRPGTGHTPFLCWTFQLLCVRGLLDYLQTAGPRCCQRVWWGGVLPKTRTWEKLDVSCCTHTLVIEKQSHMKLLTFLHKFPECFQNQGHY